MFYHPPRDGTSAQALAARAGAVVFTSGDESYLTQMREFGFSGPALQYLMANEASGPSGLVNSTSACGAYEFYPNNVSGLLGDFCTTLHSVERNFLHNSKGERLYSTQSWQDERGRHTVYLYLMNPAAPGWQAYVASRLTTVVELPYTGVFLDNVDLAPTRGQRLETNSDGTVEEYVSVGAFQASVQSYLAAVRATLPRGKQLWANMTEGQRTADNWDPYLPYLDGVMDEAFASGWNGVNDEASWLAQVRRMEAVLAQGKTFVGVVQGSQHDTQLQQFGLASYLLAADYNAYFRFANDSHYYDAWWYDDYETKLGAPLGARYMNSGGAWQREFTCGTVAVDAVARDGTITVTPATDCS
jgi:hypothetical protein